MKKAIFFYIIMCLFMACSHRNTTSGNVYTTGGNSNIKKGVRVQPTSGPTQSFLPNATAFRMSGDYSNNVAVTLSADGELLYFPSPSDITADSKPIKLEDGWWLNCQGLGPNSVFTKYTFAEYASLDAVPTPEQLKMDIIPGAKVTDFIELPMKQGEAISDLNAVKAYVHQLNR